MKSTILEARTVALVRELRTETRNGSNGTFEFKDILIRIAVDRDYKVRKTENGKTIEEYPTDFWLAKATDKVAQALSDFCTATKEDGKLVSRHLLLSGNFENYSKPRKVNVKPDVNIGGQIYHLEIETEVLSNNTIFMIDSFKFLDKNPESVSANNSTTVSYASVTPVGVAPAPVQVAQPTMAAPVQATQQTVATPVQVAQPAMAAPVAPQPVANVATAMNPPTVNPDFVPGGTNLPF